MTLLAAAAQENTPDVLQTSVGTIDALLDRHSDVIGADFPAYRNHAYRVYNFCTRLTELAGDDAEKVAVVAALHDVGIWTARTFDYLEPSVVVARRYLHDAGKSSWVAEVEDMILNHHRITPVPGKASRLADPFRRADWVDVTLGLRRSGLSRGFVSRVFRRWPTHGFHLRLVQLTLARARRHPLDPLPMVRL